jgi:hypothetical protein
MLANHEPGQLRPAAFDILGVYTVIADLRVRHRDDLPAITWVRKNLLIPGHRGVETHFAIDLAIGANRGAREHDAVF